MRELCREISPFLTDSTHQALEKVGVGTVNDFLNHNIEHLAVETGLPLRELLAVQRVLLAEFGAIPVIGDELYEEILSTAAIVPTGISKLDTLLDGGFYTHEVTEIFGGPGAGKTQLCILTALNLSRVNQQNSLLIGTNDSFPVQWLHEYAETNLMGQDVPAIVSRMMTVPLFHLNDVVHYLDRLYQNVSSQTDDFHKDLRLVVVDSASAVVAPHLGGAQSDGLGLMGYLARGLKSLAADLGLAVVVTNNVVTQNNGETRPSLGKYWSHVPNTRCRLEACSYTDREGRTLTYTECTVVKSSRRPCGVCTQYAIS